MHRFAHPFFTVSLLCSLLLFPCSGPGEPVLEKSTSGAAAAQGSAQEKQAVAAPAPKKMKIEPFTGRLKKDKVRLRLQPQYDALVIRELKRDDLVIVLDESDDFYTVEAPEGMKGYVFRTYVLDDVVEGNRVNLRLKPDLEAPVLMQFNVGDKVHGTVSSEHPKWIELPLPPSVKFYVAKEFVEKVGDRGFKERVAKRRAEAEAILTRTEQLTKEEFAKPFDQMNLEGLKAHYQHVVSKYADLGDIVKTAREKLAFLQEQYLAKKMVYLEQQNALVNSVKEMNDRLHQELQQQKEKMVQLQEQGHEPAPSSPLKPVAVPVLSAHMSHWIPQEEELIKGWSERSGSHDQESFYRQEAERAVVLQGVVGSYDRPFKNRPGDHLLLNSSSKLPVAFLYSTRVDLDSLMGKEVRLIVVPRDNHHYAFPAYFVLGLEG